MVGLREMKKRTDHMEAFHQTSNNRENRLLIDLEDVSGSNAKRLIACQNGERVQDSHVIGWKPLK
jgi:hypothetical protein